MFNSQCLMHHILNKVLYHNIVVLLLAVLLTGCSGNGKAPAVSEVSHEAMRLMQGVWMEEESETVAFRMKGDSVYYADSTSMPARFKVIGDTLYMGADIQYYIVKQSAHVLWIKNQVGETLKFVKSTDTSKEVEEEFTKKPTVLALTEVLKRDTVVHFDGERYHLYVAINPTKYKVIKKTVNDDGLEVENVYYDNIIHLSIFKGAAQLFSRDFRKQFYEQKVPKTFLSQAILNNMEFNKVDAQGFHLNASVCMPYDASCYLVETLVSFDGKLTTKVLEY